LQLQLLIYIIKLLVFSGENVEEAFLETAKKIYQNIQDGRLVSPHVLYEDWRVYSDMSHAALHCVMAG